MNLLFWQNSTISYTIGVFVMKSIVLLDVATQVKEIFLVLFSLFTLIRSSKSSKGMYSYVLEKKRFFKNNPHVWFQQNL